MAGHYHGDNVCENFSSTTKFCAGYDKIKLQYLVIFFFEVKKTKENCYNIF